MEYLLRRRFVAFDQHRVPLALSVPLLGIQKSHWQSQWSRPERANTVERGLFRVHVIGL
ncbi:hypothetical protein Fuma_05946 [Fuerstiella marisgermanici]|uniref:Uncharacterized protein n=1 Tax=Fuerstiella marisgermanici TaxID=1891926 RepID=A0A1P8WQE1_9PLAN|nr:hypothetical protein Fuma_05946 [Fuerstiella marisgermanici]